MFILIYFKKPPSRAYRKKLRLVVALQSEKKKQNKIKTFYNKVAVKEKKKK